MTSNSFFFAFQLWQNRGGTLGMVLMGFPRRYTSSDIQHYLLGSLRVLTWPWVFLLPEVKFWPWSFKVNMHIFDASRWEEHDGSLLTSVALLFQKLFAKTGSLLTSVKNDRNAFKFTHREQSMFFHIFISLLVGIRCGHFDISSLPGRKWLGPYRPYTRTRGIVPADLQMNFRKYAVMLIKRIRSESRRVILSLSHTQF